MDKKIYFILLLLLILLPNVLSIGITPARTTVNFESNLEKTISVSIVNSEHKNMDLVIYSQGELAENILLKENKLTMTKNEESKNFEYQISLPDNLSPGLHTAEIIVLQIPETSDEGDAYIGAALAVTTQLYIFVPYPGKYAEAELNIVDAEEGQDVQFVIPIINRGKLDLVNVKANIDIYGQLNEKITSFNTQSIAIESGKRTELVSNWKADVPVGIYRAVVTLIYDESSLRLEKQFNVGSKILELQNIEVNDFNLGEIAKFEMLVENKWSEQVNGAYTRTKVFNDEGEVMADFKSPTYDLPSLEKSVMISYWDTAGVKQNTYDASVYLIYGEKSSQQDFKFEVSENEIRVVGLGYVISEKGSGFSQGRLLTFLVIGVILLILINIGWFFALRKRLKK